MGRNCGRRGLTDKAARRGGAAVNDRKSADATSPASGLTPTQAGMGWEYAPAPESREIVSIAAEYGLFVDGEFGPAEKGRTFATINPASEESLARVAAASPADVDRAVAAARRAF